jgi:uncharacterized SAM-binding protein YcdF (DUF218 family)
VNGGALPRPLRRLGWLALVIVALWFGGLAWFVASSLLLRPDSASPTDAIVVLTGGRLRLETGLSLLASGAAKKLFITGVNQRVDREELLHALGPAAEHAACCIMLGHEAADTLGNARETASWMREEGYVSLRLVTSWYHMRRGLLEFRRAMPQVAIMPYPVFAPHLAPERWWSRHGAAALVVGEYGKFLATWVRPAFDPVLSNSAHSAADARR